MSLEKSLSERHENIIFFLVHNSEFHHLCSFFKAVTAGVDLYLTERILESKEFCTTIKELLQIIKITNKGKSNVLL